MATTTNYSWTTPDDTALVKDGAAAIRTLGTAVDTTTKNLNPSTTLGDIEYRSSTANTNTRLAIGSTGQILTVAGGVPSWAAPSGVNYSYDLINAGGTALTGASTITVSGISGKNFLAVVVVNGSSVNGSSSIRLRFNADSSSKYSQSGTYYRETDSIRQYVVPYNGGDSFEVGTITSNAGSAIDATLSFTGTAGTGAKIATIMGYISQPGGSGTMVNPITTGIYTGSSAVTSVSLISTSGDFDAGTLYVFGA